MKIQLNKPQAEKLRWALAKAQEADAFHLYTEGHLLLKSGIEIDWDSENILIDIPDIK